MTRDMLLLAPLLLALPARAGIGDEQDFAAAQLGIEQGFSELESLVGRLAKLESSYAAAPDLETLRPARQELHDRALQGMTRLHEKISRYDRDRTAFEVLHGSRFLMRTIGKIEALPPRQAAKESRKTARALADGSMASAMSGVYDLRRFPVDSFARLSKLQRAVEREQTVFEKALQEREKARRERYFLLGGAICLPLLLAAAALAWRRLRPPA